MNDTEFQIVYLGEDAPWSVLAQSLAGAPKVPVKVHRTESINELFPILATASWDAVLLDVHAWSYQGLHYVEKVRAEYPAIPIIALYDATVGELDVKAITSGASRCLPLDRLKAENLYSSVLSCLSANRSNAQLRKETKVNANVEYAGGAPFPTSKAQAVSHALNNLLCVITANADVLEDQLNGSGSGARSLAEIRKAAKSAADLMRYLK